MPLARLNGIIRKLEIGRPAFLAFIPSEVDAALDAATSHFDGVIFESEHGPWDARALRDCFQYMLDRRLIAASASVAPAVTPVVRIPANGGEMNQWLAKQALDIGAYGVVWPHVTSAEEAYNAVAASRYPRPLAAPFYEPAGKRGFGPRLPARYWGVDRAEYCRRADAWPLAPEGEILVILMIEDSAGIASLPHILRDVPGIGAILIGLADLAQELGHASDPEHPVVRAAVAEILAICKQAGVAAGHPLVTPANAARVIEEGFRLLVCPFSRSSAGLDAAMKLVGDN